MLKLDERDGVAPNAVAGGPAVETRLGVAFVMVGSLGFVGAAVFGFIVVAIERPFYARYWLFIGLAVCSLALFGYTSGRYIHRYARRVRVDAAGVWTRSWSGTVYCAAWPEVEWVQLANSPQRAGTDRAVAEAPRRPEVRAPDPPEVACCQRIGASSQRHAPDR